MINIPRVARKNLDTPYIHVMVQGVNKEYIFYKNEYIEKYLNIIKENKENYNFTVMYRRGLRYGTGAATSF